MPTSRRPASARRRRGHLRYGRPPATTTHPGRTRVSAAQSRTITFAYEVFREGGAEPVLLATATTKLIAIDENATPRRLPNDLLQHFRQSANPD
jgi:acyl-CoA thioesterase FadM